ncbi:hypothetical protein PSV08DRAFT_229130 [Bipolaris maydis]|uniref:uncharacterized protein n=1 Tax=Cochliobolus heterostrophus TaxID=5016 RepID=UPI0024D0CFC6|nr:hypothetical protein PSV08DRAFT_229116 [Bipolaris maydis]KAJ6267554.1 hypothetical protein PSV08DRAFT_229130 [Bipolaris maydis]
MKNSSYKAYRKQLQDRGRNGECTANLVCTERPEADKKRCVTHRTIKTARQNERRKEVKSSGKPYQKLIWVTFPDEKALAETASLAIQVFFDDHKSLGHDPWLTKARDMTLNNTVISESNAGHYIHQGLVTLLATEAQAEKAFSVEGYTWDWLEQQLPGQLLYSSCTDENNEPLRSVLFLHWTTNEPINPSLDEIYSEVCLLKHIHPTSFRVYPNEHEARQERDKLGDIRALDDIAKSSPGRFSYRPKTCYGHSRCLLENEERTVHKRTKSGCATHVDVRERGEQRQLTCYREAQALGAASQRVKRWGKKPQRKRKPQVESAVVSAHWFHQEHIPSLPECEFRVFIATEPSEKGIRGRIGKVIAIAKTTLDPKTQALAVRRFVTGDLHPPLQRCHLVEFALFVFEALRARPDSMLVFESLEVGVRLDIGLAYIDTVNKFFVNEITRWYGAHYFSHHICGEPKTQICKEFASAFSAFLNGSTSHIP